MGPQHTFTRSFSLQEHAAEQRRVHKQMLLRLRQQQQQQQQQSLLLQQTGNAGPSTAVATADVDSLAGEDDLTPLLMNSSSAPSSDDSDSHEEESDSDLDMDLDNYYFLQPVPTRQRRVLLREAGVRKIDSVEKDECRDIRTSREFCGCSCKSYCDPDSCTCAQAGIKCQVRECWELESQLSGFTRITAYIYIYTTADISFVFYTDFCAIYAGGSTKFSMRLYSGWLWESKWTCGI